MILLHVFLLLLLLLSFVFVIMLNHIHVRLLNICTEYSWRLLFPFFQVEVTQFMTVLEAFKPDIAECLCDTLPASNQTEKRIRKSVDRTLKFLDKCIAEKDSRVG